MINVTNLNILSVARRNNIVYIIEQNNVFHYIGEISSQIYFEVLTDLIFSVIKFLRILCLYFYLTVDTKKRVELLFKCKQS